MKDQKLLETLKEMGLSEHEAAVYFASLSLGSATILKIAEASEVKRTTVYSVIESLEYKGLMNVEIKGLKKLYVPAAPEKLESILEARKDRFRNLLPEFSALYNLQGGESFIKYYQGLESVKSIYESLIRDIKPHEDYLIVSDQQRWQDADKEYFLDFTKRRAKLPINIRLLLQDSPAAREAKKFEKNYNEKVKILPAGTNLTTNLVVTPQRALIHQLVPPILGIVIENKSVIQMHKEMFEIIWRSIPEQTTP
jgi:sugar-specific transcriptional regulator TrmB